MTLVQTVNSKFSVQCFLVFVLVVSNCLFNSVCSTTLEEACPTNCTCGNGSLQCSHLGLKEIPTTNLPEHVRSFYFSSNKLTSLKNFAFRYYLVLDYLDLSYNEIQIVYSKAFHGLAKLKYIDLSNNNLDYFAPNIFSDNHVLETVSFMGNRLVYFLDSPPILSSHSIASLDLSYCSLTSINAHTFSRLPNLKVLNLNSNLLREINWNQLEPLRKLSNVDLRNNMWKCDCKIVHVLNILSNRRKSINMDGEHQPVKCYEDGEYKEMWTTDFKKYCTGQAEKEESTFLQPKPEEKTAEGASTISVPKENEIMIDKPDIWNIYLHIGIIVGFILGAIFLAIVAKYCGVQEKLQIMLNIIRGRKPAPERTHELSGDESRKKLTENTSAPSS